LAISCDGGRGQKPLPLGLTPGLYRFLIETLMAGKWEPILIAEVQGETDTVSGAITFDAAT
jgi:hypothetical protein